MKSIGLQILLFASACCSESFEYGLGAGAGEPFGRAGFAFQVQEGTWAASAARHILYNEFSFMLSNGIFAIGPGHDITLGVSLGYNSEIEGSGRFKERLCLSLYDTHDIGEKSGLKAYYGWQLARYYLNEDELGIGVPIIGFGYLLEIK